MVDFMIFIDTQIWIYAQKEPDKKRYKNDEDYQRILSLHKNADKFMQTNIQSNIIGMTYHQLSEIYHNLGFQGRFLDIEFCIEFSLRLLNSKIIKWYNVNRDNIKQALLLSKDAKIHIWDYLCILPMIKEIEIIYTCDKHFQDKTFKQFNIPIQNPLGDWNIF